MDGNCSICNGFGKLSKEHLPPQSAFNNFRIAIDQINLSATLQKGTPSWKTGKTYQAGHHQCVLCEKCNNDTGGWYGAAYAEFVKQLAPFAFIGNTHAVITSTLGEIYPLRVAKQALATLCGSCGPGLAEKNPVFRQLLLDPHARGSIRPWGLYCYLRNDQGMRCSGLTAKIDHNNGNRSTLIAEFSWWPVGWILAQGEPKGGLQAERVDHWFAQYEYDEARDFDVFLPCHWTETWYPADFRDPKTIERDRFKNSGLILPD
jgi:hypothetical protein